MVAACKRANITTTLAYTYRAQDAEFAENWDAAIAKSVSALEEMARKRALTYSDTLLIFLLKGNMPEKYGDRVQVVTEERILGRVEEMAKKLGVDPTTLLETARMLAATDVTLDGNS